jgi:hypothetical protein
MSRSSSARLKTGHSESAAFPGYLGEYSPWPRARRPVYARAGPVPRYIAVLRVAVLALGVGPESDPRGCHKQNEEMPTVVQLRKELQKKGLPTAGLKAELQERLDASDQDLQEPDSGSDGSAMEQWLARSRVADPRGLVTSAITDAGFDHPDDFADLDAEVLGELLDHLKDAGITIGTRSKLGKALRRSGRTRSPSPPARKEQKNISSTGFCWSFAIVCFAIVCLALSACLWTWLSLPSICGCQGDPSNFQGLISNMERMGSTCEKEHLSLACVKVCGDRRMDMRTSYYVQCLKQHGWPQWHISNAIDACVHNLQKAILAALATLEVGGLASSELPLHINAGHFIRSP